MHSIGQKRTLHSEEDESRSNSEVFALSQTLMDSNSKKIYFFLKKRLKLYTINYFSKPVMYFDKTALIATIIITII